MFCNFIFKPLLFLLKRFIFLLSPVYKVLAGLGISPCFFAEKV
ncbi:hypothetical protein G134_1475 [Lactobacillus delbrueckii subsp. lactis CRL581]|nr:hypothetical protein G134_1475 [Lactobacillus delbrueckii subsp. lactis CRL581]